MLLLNQSPSSRPRSTLRMDPSRTALIRKRFMADMNKGFVRLKEALTVLVEKEDAFGLKERSHDPAKLTGNRRYMALTTPQQLEAFKQWLKHQVDTGVLRGVETGSQNWLKQYIEESYRKGQGRAFDDARKRYADKNSGKMGSYYKGTRDEFLNSSFNRPASVERVQLLAARTYTDLKGTTEQMQSTLHRTLMDGMIQGKSPRELGRQLNKVVDGYKNRGMTIARTETVRAHADGQLDALKNLGVEEVGVMVEWSAAADDLVCPLCADMDGAVLKLVEASHIIPRHPNCRCAWIPANVGEDTKSQKRGVEAKKALDESIRKEIPKKEQGKRTLAEQRKLSRWAGADVKPTKPLQSPLTPTKEKEKPIKEKKTAPILPPKPTLPQVQAPAPLVSIPPGIDPTLSLEEKLKSDVLEDLRKKFLVEAEAGVKKAAALRQEFDLANKVISSETHEWLELTERIDVARKLGDTAEMNRLKALREICDQKTQKLSDRVEVLKKEMSLSDNRQRNHLRESLKLPSQERCSIKTASDKKIRTYTGSNNQPKFTLVQTEPDDKLKEAKDFLQSLTSNKSGEMPDITITRHVLEDGERAFCKPTTTYSDASGIYVTRDEAVRVYVHEIGHEVEARIKDGYKLAKEFRDLRVARAGTPDVNLAVQFPGSNYGANEIGNKDDFLKAFGSSESSAYYAGKTYGASQFTEIVSMGVEEMYTHPVRFAKSDPEYFNFIVGFLRGVL